MGNVWSWFSSLVLAIAPVFMAGTFAFSAWATTEIFSQKFTSLHLNDRAGIVAEARVYTDSRYDVLLAEINRLRVIADQQTKMLAETLTEVKNLKENSK